MTIPTNQQVQKQQELVVGLWNQMCEYDKVEFGSVVVFSSDNPFAAEYNAAVSTIQDMMQTRFAPVPTFSNR